MDNASVDSIVAMTYDLMRTFRQKIHCGHDGHSRNLLQTYALALIDDQPGITMTSLSHAMHVTSPTATTFVARLVKQGLVTRDHDSKNRKLVRLKITREGSELLRIQKEHRTEAVRRILSTLSSLEIDQLAVILRKLRSAQASIS